MNTKIIISVLSLFITLLIFIIIYQDDKNKVIHFRYDGKPFKMKPPKITNNSSIDDEKEIYNYIAKIGREKNLPVSNEKNKTTFYMTFGDFISLKDAEYTWKNVLKSGKIIDSRLRFEVVKCKDDNKFCISLGPFNSSNDAKNLCSNLFISNKDCWYSSYSSSNE